MIRVRRLAPKVRVVNFAEDGTLVPKHVRVGT